MSALALDRKMSPHEERLLLRDVVGKARKLTRHKHWEADTRDYRMYQFESLIQKRSAPEYTIFLFFDPVESRDPIRAYNNMRTLVNSRA